MAERAVRPGDEASHLSPEPAQAPCEGDSTANEAPPEAPPARLLSTRAGLGLFFVSSLAAFAPMLGRSFATADDWVRIDIAAGLVAGEPAAWHAALYGASPLEAVRLTAWPTWVLDYLVHGFSTSGYFLLNLLAFELCAVFVFLLARRLGGSAALGLLAAGFFAFNPATAQPLFFLAARDDLLATLVSLGLLCSWHRLQADVRGLGLAALLYALACFAKGPAIALPLGLLALDAVEGRLGGWYRGRHALLRSLLFGGVVLLYGAVLLSVVGWDPLMELSFGEEGAPGPGLIEVAIELVVTLLLPSLAIDRPGAPVAVGLLPLLPLAAAWFLASKRGGRGALSTLGLAWLGLMLLPQLPFLMNPSDIPGAAARYLLLPSAGVALLLAGLVHRASAGLGPRAPALIAVTTVLLGAASFGLVARHHLWHRAPAVPALLAALDAAAAQGPVQRLAVGVQQAGSGVEELLASNALERRLEDLEQLPSFYVQGRQELFEAQTTPFQRGALSLSSVSLDLGPFLVHPGAVVIEEAGFVSSGRPQSALEGTLARLPGAGATTWAVTRDVGTTSRREPDPSTPALAWDLAADGSAWSEQGCEGGAALAECLWAAEKGWLLRSQRSFGLDEVRAALRFRGTSLPPRIVGPEVQIDSAAHCQALVTLRGWSFAGREVGQESAVLLGWSDAPEVDASLRGAVVVPIRLDGRLRQVPIRLDTSLDWREGGLIRRLSLVSSHEAADVEVHGVQLRACREYEPWAGALPGDPALIPERPRPVSPHGPDTAGPLPGSEHLR